ncbi:MAG: histidinol dehydrogenase [Solirubrobacterales bacterium]
MRVSRFEWNGSDPRALAAEIRGSRAPAAEISSVVAKIIEEVRRGGDAALASIEGSHSEWSRTPFTEPKQRVRSAASRVDPEVIDALETAAANIRAVAETQLAGEGEVELEQGQTVELRDVPVASAGIYAPGGAAAYPSTVLMGCLPAKVAGVPRVALATPLGSDEGVPDVVLAAAAIGGADEVHAMSGAQAIAALAVGTERIAPVDVIAGPGNRFVQEAKRQLYGEVGIDGIAGPSELMAIVGETANPQWVALDICAQAEHSSEGLLVVVAVESATLDRIEDGALTLTAERGIVTDPTATLIEVPDTAAGITLAQALAPEHLEILTEDAELLAGAVTTAGCVFTGERGATAFGDYAAGSNHILPTGGAGRFQGPLGPGVFRRRLATVKMTQQAARELAPTVATLARAEGFPVHAESAEVRGRSEGEAEERPV